MPVCEILLLGNPMLWRPSSVVADPSSSATAATIADLAATLSDFRARHGFGRAIAAPQIGRLERIIFVRLDAAGLERPLVNPVITSRSDEMFELWDDCFSFPDLMVRVRRHRAVTVEYSDPEGIRRHWSVEGDISELLQHEIDHLDGVLAVDRAVDARGLAVRRELQRRASI
ncbi:MAG: peptide deformylase [Acidobacteria bacterium]|nr:peptide deformylase [Acidobacteriota bacterium]MCW5967366.1 peptide deformylase [Blastocatellales bacterium]